MPPLPSSSDLDATIDPDAPDLLPGAASASTTAPDAVSSRSWFRSDIQGLRAVAILLVVLYHAGVPGLSGGYVGVDVFFVISGFVITGVLLREREGTGGTSFATFYARRIRRILPAASLVIVATALASFALLGFVTGDTTAAAGRWAAVFLANFHFTSMGTDYLASLRPPSALQNFWSLAVEEQFYVVYPMVFFLVVRAKGTKVPRRELLVMLAVLMAASFWWSIAQTASNPTAAYFSPLTRAWELGLGASIAVASPWLAQVPGRIAASMTWVGVGLILFAGWNFTAAMAYPGWRVAVPVVGSALVIAGGTVPHAKGAGLILALRPLVWIGVLSYALYLWHWPILVIASEQSGRTTLPLSESLVLVALALGLAWITYRIIERPILHKWSRASQSLRMGLVLVSVTLVLLTVMITVLTPSTAAVRVVPAPTQGAVVRLVAASPGITAIPSRLSPSLADADHDWGAYRIGPRCIAGTAQSSSQVCILGDTAGKHLMVIYGDSHAVMWLPALIAISTAAHWQLVILSKVGCPSVAVSVARPFTAVSGGPYVACDQWHQWASSELRLLHPDLVIFSQGNFYTTPTTLSTPSLPFTKSEWGTAMSTMFRVVGVTGARQVFLGNIPLLPQNAQSCLAAHQSSVQVCSAPVTEVHEPLDQVEVSAAASSNIPYVDPTPWFCSATCTAVIGHYVPYLDRYHVTDTYARYLEIVLGNSLGFGSGR